SSCDPRRKAAAELPRHTGSYSCLFLWLATENCQVPTSSMHWFERKIRQYEHRRWTTDDNRRVQPFDWGLEHIGGARDAADPAAYVREYSKWAIEHSKQWFEVTPASDYALDAEGVLTF